MPHPPLSVDDRGCARRGRERYGTVARWAHMLHVRPSTVLARLDARGAEFLLGRDTRGHVRPLYAHHDVRTVLAVRDVEDMAAKPLHPQGPFGPWGVCSCQPTIGGSISA